MDEQTVMEKQRNRRTRTILVIGIAFVAVGLLFCLATQITTLHHYTQYCPDGNGGVIPIQRSDAAFPYLSLWVPGVILLIVGPVVIIFSFIIMRRNKRCLPGEG